MASIFAPFLINYLCHQLFGHRQIKLTDGTTVFLADYAEQKLLALIGELHAMPGA